MFYTMAGAILMLCRKLLFIVWVLRGLTKVVKYLSVWFEWTLKGALAYIVQIWLEIMNFYQL